MSEKNQKNFQNENKISDRLFRLIEQACEGLFYMSETDAPVLAFRGSAASDVTGGNIIHQTGASPETTIQEVSFEYFFERLTRERDWFGDAETVRAKKFLELQKLLEENLREQKVYRVGHIQLDIYAVGLTADGCLMGIMTKAVET